MNAELLLLLARGVWPGALFSRLYRMPWYGGLLRTWALQGTRPGQRVLELGCAGGDLAADLAGAGLEVMAVERSHIASAAARRRAPAVRVVNGDALSAPLPIGTFDLVLAASLLNVVPDSVALLSRMRQLARPGGIVRVLVPDAAFEDHALQLLRDGLRLISIEDAALLLWHRAARKVIETTLGESFSRAGLAQLRVSHCLAGMVLCVDASEA